MRIGGLFSIVVALLAIGAALARAEPFVLVADGAASVAATDGHRFAVFMGDARTAHVFDQRFGTESDVAVPASCADPVALEDVGGGQALVNCGDRGTWHEEGEPLLLDLGSQAWHEPPGATAVLRRIETGDDSGSFTRIGANWLAGEERGDHSYGALWLEWHTGEFRDDEGDARHVPALDAPDLFVPLCRPLGRSITREYDDTGDGPRFERMIYASPLAYFGLTVQRCGSARRTRLDTAGVATQAAGGVATWGHGTAVRAYQPYCGVRFSQSLDAAPSTVAHSDGWIYASVPRDDGRYRIVHAPQPRCPDLAGPRGLRVESAGHGRVAALRGWLPATSEWSETRLPLVVHHARTLDLRPGAQAVVRPACFARSVRWRLDAGRWRDMGGQGMEWRFRAPARIAAGRLGLDVRCSTGERGTFALPVS